VANGFPAGGFSPLFLLLLHLLLRRTAWDDRGGSPGVVRVWGSRPARRWLLYRAVRPGTRGRPGCTGARGTPRRRRRGQRSPRLCLWASGKGKRKVMTRSHHRGPGCGPAGQRRCGGARLVGLRRAVGWAAMGSKRRWADWVAGGPISTVTLPFFL
jgi:hypothetical protein